MRSGLSGEAGASAGCTFTGRMLANRPRALRIASSPCSGRTLALGSSHFGPPTAPRRMAEAFRQAASAESVKAVPWASMAQPPISWVS